MIDPSWMPPAKMSRIILHWTVGGPKPSEYEAGHYHFLIDASGKVTRGKYPVSANAKLTEAGYAAHVGGLNGGSIGVAMCGMIGAQGPGKVGPHPLNQDQWDTAVALCAQLCRHYRIGTGPREVLGHCEVKGTLGVDQAGKWDPWLGLPGIKQCADVPSGNWGDIQKGWTIIGDRFRQEVAEVMTLKVGAK